MTEDKKAAKVKTKVKTKKQVRSPRSVKSGGAAKVGKPVKGEKRGAKKSKGEIKSGNNKEVKLAVLELGGSQHLVREGLELEVNRLPLEKGKKETIDGLILRPALGRGSITYRLMEQKRGPKVITMKYKAKSRYRKKRGFKADLSRILVEKIGG